MRCLDIRHHQRDRDKRHLAIEQSRILRMSGASFCDNGEYSLLAKRTMSCHSNAYAKVVKPRQDPQGDRIALSKQCFAMTTG